MNGEFEPNSLERIPTQQERHLSVVTELVLLGTGRENALKRNRLVMEAARVARPVTHDLAVDVSGVGGEIAGSDVLAD